jgi:molybdate/tungstate transport system ATP-binding protein
MEAVVLSLQAVGVKQAGFELANISFTVQTGQYAALVGPTGCGKTTLLEVITGLRTPCSGKVLLRGEDATRWLPHQRRLGYVPQDAAVFPSMTVAQNIGFSMKEDSGARVQELAEALNLTAILHRQAVNLSGGEAQRVALARALAPKPDILLLDEPMSAVDDDTKQAMRRVLQARHGSTTVLHVTHQLDELATLADVVLELSKLSA